jgi:DNA-binding CsgD family transcriptional regulator
MQTPEGDGKAPRERFERSALALVQIDDHRRVVDANAAALATLGVSREEVGTFRVAVDGAQTAPPGSLSAREREILTRVAHGQDGPEIAAVLVVSPATVRTHIGNAIRKLGAHSRAHAVAIAMRSGLLDD